MYLNRYTSDEVVRSLKGFPIVFVNGARQSGKSTLVEHLLTTKNAANYISFDDTSALAAAVKDPAGFVNGLSTPATIDEVQRVPELFLPLKKVVDTYNKNGMFVLTGSANVLTMPKIADSLAGRMIVHTLWPLAQSEIHGHKENFINLVFSDDQITSPKKQLTAKETESILFTGGYPRVLSMDGDRQRDEWFNSYISSILQKDIRELANIERLSELPYLLNVIAGRAGNLSNLADFGRILKISHTTLKRYYTLLKVIFFVVELPAWSTNREKTLVKTPKVFLNDSGLLCHLLRYDHRTFTADRSKLGPVLENFIVMELIKQKAWSEDIPDIYHFRTKTGQEVDVVLEGRNKKIVGIEVKAAAAVNSDDFSGLEKLATIARDRFVKGVVLYQGKHVIPFGKNMFAVPLQKLWS